MNPREAKQHVEQVINVVGNLNTADALRVLNMSVGRVLEQVGQSKTGEFSSPAIPFPHHLLHRNIKGSKIERDLELQRFLHSSGRDLTIEEIASMCRKKFGAKRAPSKSAIHRYIKKLKYMRKGGV